MTDLTIPGTIVAASTGAAILWVTKRLLAIGEEVIRNWMAQIPETRKLLDAHVQDCMLRRQSEAQLVEQVAGLDDKVCDMGMDIGKVDAKLDRLMDHLLK